MNGTVVIVASGKGGTGKTSFCAGVAVALCAFGEKVLLIDADWGNRCLDLVLGMAGSLVFSFSDVLSGTAGLKEAAVRHPVVKNLRMLTAGNASLSGFSDSALAGLINKARAHYTYIIVDCAAGFSQDILRLSKLSDRTVIVSTGESTALRAAQALSGQMLDTGVHDIKIVVNRVHSGAVKSGAAVNIDRAMDAAGLALLGAVPEDDDVSGCGNEGQVLMLHSVGPAQAAYMNIAKRLRGERVPLFIGVGV